MNPVIKLNDKITVAVAFKKDGGIEDKAFPAKMIWNGKEIVFTKLGIHHPTSEGHKVIHIFNMSDGVNDYRLEFDAERLKWKLTEIIDNAGLLKDKQTI